MIILVYLKSKLALTSCYTFVSSQSDESNTSLVSENGNS